MEGHWFERRYDFAGVVHWFNIVLKAPRRDHGAQLSVAADAHSHVRRTKRPVVDTVDKAASASRKDAADAYHAGFVPRVGSCVVDGASGIAEVNVFDASDQVLSCLETHGCVEIRVGIVQC